MQLWSCWADLHGGVNFGQCLCQSHNGCLGTLVSVIVKTVHFLVQESRHATNPPTEESGMSGLECCFRDAVCSSKVLGDRLLMHMPACERHHDARIACAQKLCPYSSQAC